MPVYIQTDTVAQAVRDRIWSQWNGPLKLEKCELGDLVHLAGQGDLLDHAPFVMVQPLRTDVGKQEIGKSFLQTETLRILYGKKLDPKSASPVKDLIADVKQIADDLMDNPKATYLTLVSGTKRHAKVTRIEWKDTPEESAMVELEIPLMLAAITFELLYHA